VDDPLDQRRLNIHVDFFGSAGSMASLDDTDAAVVRSSRSTTAGACA
jgi:hypothetical protein